MTSTSTLGAGLIRFLNTAAALAVLFAFASGASAQSTIFVDANGGSDGNNGQQPTISAGVNGPVATLDRALELAAQDGAGNTISIEAGVYDADLIIQNTTGSTALNNLTFLSRPDQANNTEVELDVDGGVFFTNVPGFTFASQGGGDFTFTGGGGIDLQGGSVAFGTGVVTIDGIDVVERTNATVTGSVAYGSVPDVIRYNGDASVTQGTLLPSSLDIASGTLLIDIALGSVAATVNDNTRTFTLGAGGLTLGDDGGEIVVQLRDGNVIAGTITVVDGSGGDLTGNVLIDGEGSVGDLIVDGGRLIYSLEEADVSDADTDNEAASVRVNSGQFVLPNESPDADDLDRFVVAGDFTQTGGQVLAANPDDTILVVEGDFNRSANAAGNFSPLNLYLEGSAAADFAPGTGLTINSLHINYTGSAPEGEKMVTFLQDITVNSSATGTNGVNNVIAFIVTDDAQVDLNGNLVNITQGGESIVDGTLSDSDNSGAVRFVNNGGVASGTGIYSSIIVDGDDITAEDEFDFTGSLILLDGGINVAAGSDVSPLGDNASVIVNIAANNPPQITGTFNDDEREYDLTYQDSAENNAPQTFVADVEFDTDFIRDLLVDVTNATVSVPATVTDGTISGDVTILNGNIGATTAATETATLEFNGQTVEVEGTTTIEDNAVLDLLAGAEYQTGSSDNVLDGRINGAGSINEGTLLLLDGASFTGSQTSTTGTTAATNEAQIWATIAIDEGASATLSQIRVIAGDIVEDDPTGADAGGTLTVGLVADNDDDGDDRFDEEENGNINGLVTLPNSTLALASDVELTIDDETIEVGTLDTQGNVFFLEGPDALELGGDVLGTGAVWPASDFLVINGDTNGAGTAGVNPDQLTIPVFHPGDEPSDVTVIDANILVTNTLRLTGELDAESNDDEADNDDVDFAVTLEGQDGDVPTLILDNGYEITSDGANEPENSTDDEIIISGPLNLTTNESGTVDVYTDLVVLATENVQTFRVTNTAALNAENTVYQVVNFEATSANGRLDLASNDLSVTGDATLDSDGALFNTAAGTDDREVSEGVLNPNFSTFSFIGATDATLTVTPNANTGVTTFGNGVDLRIAKDASTTTVTLQGGALVFDDDFSAGGGGDDDETLVLEMGTFVAGDPASPNDIYVRLDHSNSLIASGSSDDGQGFVFVPSNTQFPEAFVEGNVRKRIYSDPSLFAGDITPGRVVYPVGTSDNGDEGYAEFVLDFESIAEQQSFGQRSVTVSFVDEFDGGSAGLPISSTAGTQVDEPANFYWLVRSNPSLGSGTNFNVEARYDGFELVSDTNDGTAATIDELTLIRRQFGDGATNPYTLVSETYDNFLLLDADNDTEPVVVAQDAEAFLGPQGTIFTFGLTQGNRPTSAGTEVPTEFALNGNLPNPFSTRTAISFDLPEAAEVSLEVYDVMGRRVVTLNKGAMTAGADQRVEIDGTGLASGVYVYRLNVVGASETWSRGGQITLAR